MKETTTCAQWRWLAGMVLLVIGCRSAAQRPGLPAGIGQVSDSAWSPLTPELPATWRNLRLFAGEYAFVLASSEAAALQVHAFAFLASRLFVDEFGRQPRRGLLIAGSKEDPLLVEGAEAFLEALPRWNADATGREPPPTSRSRRGRGRGELPAELTVRLVAGGIPVDEPSLDLPPTLRERIAYVAWLPSDDCLEATCAAITALALEREGVSWLQQKLAEAVVGDPAQRMIDEFRAQSLWTLLDLVSWSEGLEEEEAEALVARAVASGALPERIQRRAGRRSARAHAGGADRP